MPEDFSEDAFINIVACSDANYACHLCVMLRSLLDNKTTNRPCRVFIVDGGLGDVWKTRAREIVEHSGSFIRFIDPPDGIPDTIPTFGHINRAAYLRLLLPEALPREVGRIIYLDCDLIVKGGIEELWGIEIGTRAIGAVPDAGMESSAFGRKRKRQLGMSWDSRYYNSGVMLIDMVNARAAGVFEAALQYVIENPARIRFADQDGLNATVGDQAMEIPIFWNVQPGHFSRFIDGSKIKPAYSRRRAPPKIVHYCEKRKPWSRKLNHPYEGDYVSYLKRLPWHAPFLPKRSFNEQAKWAMKRALSMLGLRGAIESLELAYECQLNAFGAADKRSRRFKILFCLSYFPFRAHVLVWARIYCFYKYKSASWRNWRGKSLRVLERLTRACVPRWVYDGWNRSLAASRALCDCCGILVYSSEAASDGEICPFCSWELDSEARAEPSRPSARNGLSLLEARRNYARQGAYHPRFAGITQKPSAVLLCADALSAASRGSRSLN